MMRRHNPTPVPRDIFSCNMVAIGKPAKASMSLKGTPSTKQYRFISFILSQRKDAEDSEESVCAD